MASNITKLSLALAILVFMAGCDKKSCKNTTCPTLEECSSGQCICQDGYEGNDCSTLSNTKYLGTYLVTETCNNAPYNYTGYSINVVADAINPDIIHFQGFFSGQTDIAAYIYNVPGNLGNNLSIPSNQGQGSIQINTSQGSYYTNSYGIPTLQLQLNYTNQSGVYGCTEILNKQ